MAVDAVRLGVFSPSAVVVMGDELGVFESAGIRLEVCRVSSSVEAFGDLERGALDLLVTSPDNVLAYRLGSSNPLGRRIDVQMLAGVDLGLGLSLMCSPGQPLPGAHPRVGVDAPQTGFAYAAYTLLDRLGAKLGSYDVVELGATPARRAALVQGRCDVTMLNAGHDVAAEEEGCSRSLVVSEELGPYLGSVLVGVQTWADAHGDLLRRLLLAWQAASRAVVDQATAPTLKVRLQELLRCGARHAERAAETLRSPTEGLLLDGQVDLAALQTVIDLRAGYDGFAGGDAPVAGRAFESGLARPLR